jgi:hypothetical protein
MQLLIVFLIRGKRVLERLIHLSEGFGDFLGEFLHDCIVVIFEFINIVIGFLDIFKGLSDAGEGGVDTGEGLNGMRGTFWERSWH